MTIDAIFGFPSSLLRLGNKMVSHMHQKQCMHYSRVLKACDKVDINIFTDQRFKKFSQILDAEMKTLKATGKYEKNLQTS